MPVGGGLVVVNILTGDSLDGPSDDGLVTVGEGFGPGPSVIGPVGFGPCPSVIGPVGFGPGGFVGPRHIIFSVVYNFNLLIYLVWMLLFSDIYRILMAA